MRYCITKDRVCEFATISGYCHITACIKEATIDDNIKQLPSIQPDITHIISETLHECGIYGEEATVKLIGTLKRLGRDDLLLPCVR